MDDAVRTKRDLLEVAGRRDHCEHHIRCGRQCRRCVVTCGTDGHQRLRTFHAARPNTQLMATLVQMLRHVAPHGAQSDESDFQFQSPDMT